VAGVPAKVIRQYVPGDGWARPPGSAPPGSAPPGSALPESAPAGSAGPSSAGAERVEGIAQPPDPRG
jgi:hypothetical protein